MRTIAVVIVTHNSGDDLPGLLASLPEATSFSMRVIVVDSGSTDGSLAVAQRCRADVETVDLGANLGYAAGVNAGWRAAGDVDAIVLLNPDLAVDASSFERWVDAAAGDVGIVVPVILDESGVRQPSLRRRPSPKSALAEAIVGGTRAARWGIGELITDPDAYRSPTEADWATGAAMVITAACHHAVGPWEERFFLYAEEVDFCLRARARGFVMRLEPDAHVVHRGGEMSTAAPLFALMSWNRVRLMRAHHGRGPALLLRVGAAIGEALRSVAGARAGVHRAALQCLVLRSARERILPPEAHLDWSGARSAPESAVP